MHPREETIITTPQGVQTVYSKHQFLETNIGSHSLLCCGHQFGETDDKDIADMLDSEDIDLEEKSTFSKYGTGIVLLFKFISYMFSVFVVLSILSLPSIYIYAESDALTNEMVTVTQQMAAVSLGNLGEGHTECNAEAEPIGNTAADAGTLHIGCPAGASIGSINAIYGDVRGVCGCPSSQTPTTSCPSTFPYLSSAREATMPNGAKFKTTPCCSAEADSAGRPLFPELQFEYNNVSSVGDPSCASETAQTIVGKRCLGRTACTVSAKPDLHQAWAVPSADQCLTSAGFRLRELADGTMVCSNSLSGNGMTACPTSPRRLVVVARCFADHVQLGPFGSFTKQEVAIMVAVFDAMAILVFILLVRNLTRREKREAEFRSSTSISDYTVFIPSLPEHDTIHELDRDLRQFLEAHLNACEPVPMIHDTDVDKNLKLPLVKVVDVNFGLSDTRLIAWNKLRGELLYKLETAEKTHLVLTQGQETYKKLQEWSEKGLFDVGCCARARRHPYIHAKIAFDNMESLIKKIAEVDEEIKIVLHGGVVSSPRSPKADEIEIEATHAKCAYVTFETAESALRARREFPNSRVLGWCTRQYVVRNGGDDLLLAGIEDKRPIPVMPEKYNMHAIRTRNAPEPSDIVWENVGTPRLVRCAKQGMTSLATLAFLFGIFILVFYLEDAKRSIQLEHPQVECSQFADVDNVAAAVYDEMLVLSDSYAASNPNKTRTGRMECFCQELLSNNSGNPLSLESFLFTVPYPEGAQKEALCWDWFQSFVSAQAITYGVAVLTLVLNSLAKPFVAWMVEHESRRSRGSQLYSLATKLFGFQFVNTGLVVLLVNSYFEQQWFFFGKGTYSDFDSEWYLGPGTSITVTMFLMIFTPQIARLGRGLSKWMSICRDRNCSFNKNVTNKITQNEFNKLFEGQSMEVAERYAQMLTVAFVALAYSAMLPVLIPIAALFFGLMLVSETMLFIHCYRTPPAFAPALAKSMSSLLMYAVPAHLAFGLWAMTNPDIFPSTDALQTAMDASLSANSTSTALSVSNAAEKGLAQVAALDTGGLEFSTRFESTAGIVLFASFLAIASCLVFQAVLFRWVRQVLVVIGKCCSEKRKLRKDLPPLYEALPVADINATMAAGKKSLERRQKGHLWSIYKQAHAFNLRHQKATDIIASALQRIKQLEQEAYEAQSRQEATENQINHIENFRSTAEVRWRQLRLTPDSDEKSAAINDVMDQLETYDAEVAGLKLQKQEEDANLEGMADLYDQLNAAIQEAKLAAATKEVVEKGSNRIEGLASYSMQSHPEYAAVFGFSVNIFDNTLSAKVQRSGTAQRHAKQQAQLVRHASVRVQDHTIHTIKHLRSFHIREQISPVASSPTPSPSAAASAADSTSCAADTGDVELVSLQPKEQVDCDSPIAHGQLIESTLNVPQLAQSSRAGHAEESKSDSLQSIEQPALRVNTTHTLNHASSLDQLHDTVEPQSDSHVPSALRVHSEESTSSAPSFLDMHEGKDSDSGPETAGSNEMADSSELDQASIPQQEQDSKHTE